MKSAELVLLLVCCGTAFSWNQCDNVKTTGTLNRVEISTCSEDHLPCVLHKETEPQISVFFTPAASVSELTISVSANFSGLVLPFPGLPSDACNSEYGITCPLVKDVQYNYSNAFKVYGFYPLLKNIPTIWKLKDECDVAIICFEVPVSIVQAAT